MGWEMSVGFGLSTNLQRWNGHQWDPAGSQPVKPPSPASAPVNGTEHAVQPSSNGASHAAAAPQASAQASQSGNGTDAPGSSSDSSPAPGSISTSVAQAMLECHYSFNNAFLEDEPLLEASLDALSSHALRALVCLQQGAGSLMYSSQNLLHLLTEPVLLAICAFQQGLHVQHHSVDTHTCFKVSVTSQADFRVST